MANEVKRLIQVRVEKGANFKRDGFGKKRQLSDSWRKPRGQHNKQREQRKAKGALPKPGFGSPVAVRGMHPSGFFEVLVSSEKELEGLNPKTHAVRISATVGERKRGTLQEKAVGAGLKVLNPRLATAAQKAKKPAKPAAAESKPPKEEKKPLKTKLSAALAPKKEAKKEKATAEKKEKSAPVKPAKKADKPKTEKAAAKKSEKPGAKVPAKPAAKAEKKAPAKPAEAVKTKSKGAAVAKPKSAKKAGSGVKKDD